MTKHLSCLAVLVTFSLTLAQEAQPRDPREQYGTRSLETARWLTQAIELSNSKQHVQALEAAEKAVRADGQCLLALYWKSLILSDLGRIDDAIAGFRKIIDMDNGSSVPADAATDLGLLYLGLDKPDQGLAAFSQAVRCDPANQFHQLWKPYRNMAIELHKQGQYLSAALAAALGRDADPSHVEKDMVDQFVVHAAEQHSEGARVLFLDEPASKVLPRGRVNKLEEIPVEGDVPQTAPSDPRTTSVNRILSDDRSPYLVGIEPRATYYYLIDTSGAQVHVKKIAVSEPVIYGQVVQGKLYLVLARATAVLCQVDMQTGKSATSISLGVADPSSIVVYPSRNAAYFVADHKIQWVDLVSGKVSVTQEVASFVAPDRREDILFAYLRNEPRNSLPQDIVVNGHLVMIMPSPTADYDWAQTHLMKYRLFGNRPVMEGLRLNAASNSWKMLSSGDGSSVGLIGGGGWRPEKHGGPAGYGVALFEGQDLRNLRGFYPTEVHPLAGAINPVTGQLALFSSGTIRVFDMADPAKYDSIKKTIVLTELAWSGDGRYLIGAVERGGFIAYVNELGETERANSTTWWKKAGATATRPANHARPPAVNSAQPVAALRGFKPSGSKQAAVDAVNKALAARHEDRPLDWASYEPYRKEEQATKELNAILGGGAEGGIRIYRMRDLRRKYPKNTVIELHMAELLANSGQWEEAEPQLHEVLATDLGRTDLSTRALVSMARMYVIQKKEPEAIQCLAACLLVDLGNQQAVDMIIPLLEKQGATAQAAQLKQRANRTPVAPGRRSISLPPPPGSKDLSAQQIYDLAVNSVVLVQSGDSIGAGVCVSKPNLVITNKHVIKGAGAVSVTPFVLRDGHVTKLPRITAHVIFQAEGADLAVLEMDAPGADVLTPLAVATAGPRSGEEVYALGHPGSEGQALEMTLTNGIVSNADRMVNGGKYIQHTAAISPGNSGGPLLNKRGELLGLNTLGSDLPGVGFAIPAKIIRAKLGEEK